MTANNYTDLREALKKTLFARNITAVVLKGDLRHNQPCNYEIPFELFADFITQRETAASKIGYIEGYEQAKAGYGSLYNNNLAELKTLKPDKE